MLRFHALFSALVLLCVATMVVAQEPTANPSTYHSSKGYALVPPDGWISADAKTRDSVLKEVGETYPGLKQADFSKIDSIFYGPVIDGFAVNINVVVVPGSPRVTSAAAAQYPEQLQTQLRGTGITASDITARVDQVNHLPCIAAEHHAMAGTISMTQWQFLVPARNVTYVVTFSCPVNYTEQFRSTVQSVMAGFAVDHPARSAGPDYESAAMYFVYACVGVAIVIWLILKLKNRTANS
ncbi:MAG: hypothetical protein WC058_12445 [Phycisphaeraceae bacterium]